MCSTPPKLRALMVFGTRPEAIKMAPLVAEGLRRGDCLEPIVCLTGQHREMLAQVTGYFGIRADVDLNLMRPDQTLAGLSSCCLEAVDRVLGQVRPHCVVVQGDTTTAMVASMAAFFRRVPVVHVEAGLRSGDLAAPWPEEFNRRVADLAASLWCAPTRRAADCLLAEGTAPDRVHVTGNTVIDALVETVRRERANQAHWLAKYSLLADRPLVLITGHRRESFGEGLESICRAVAQLAERFAGCEFLYPVHLNPNVQEPVRRLLSGRPNVHLADPVPYPEFVWLMDRSTLILTDSGGVQEEAPSLGKPVLVMRETTERPEAVEAGVARLVGTSPEAIVAGAAEVLADREQGTGDREQGLGDRSGDCSLSPVPYPLPAPYPLFPNPYGDGQAARRIVDLMLDQGWQE
jgi:UDP-N-acetylglucosamine 2-epimerase (non-hydrolysing)